MQAPIRLPQRRHRQVTVLATEGVSLSSLWIFCDLVRLGSAIMAERNAILAGDEESDRGNLSGPLSLTVLSADGQPVLSACGQKVAVEGSLADARRIGLLILPSQSPLQVADVKYIAPGESSLPSLLPAIWQDGAIVAAAGSSVGKLALAGMLDGRIATTHQTLQGEFQRNFPEVRLDLSQDITEDSNIFCARGLTSEIVLACELLSRLSAHWVGEAMLQLSFAPGFEPNSSRMPTLLSTPSSSDEVVAKALLWISRNYCERVGSSRLASVLSISKSSLLRRFKREMGITPHAYMRNLRLDVAARLLRISDMKIEHIAARVGYNDSDFFRRIFRQCYGASPLDYRQNRNSG